MVRKKIRIREILLEAKGFRLRVGCSRDLGAKNRRYFRRGGEALKFEGIKAPDHTAGRTLHERV